MTTSHYYLAQYQAILDRNATSSNDMAGYYNKLDNRVVFTNKNYELNLKSIIHELSHKVMDSIFNNDSAPFNDSLKDKYHLAIKNTLLNIHKFIQQDFGLEIILEDSANRWKIGENIGSMLFPEESRDINKSILSFKSYNLELDDQFSWLGGYSLISKAIGCLNFELSDALVGAGAKIPFVPNYMTHPDILNWFIYNKQKIDLDYKDCYEKTVLDLANGNQDLIHKFIVNSDVYPPNYNPTCIVNYQCPEIKSNMIEIEEQLYAIKILLDSYNTALALYNENSEDSEFIVRLPQIIAAGLYKDKIIEILEPMAEYWHEYITLPVQKNI